MRRVLLMLMLAASYVDVATVARADTTVTLQAEAGAAGGFIRSSDASNSQGGDAVPGADPRVGDRGSDDLTYRGFVSFDLGAVPAGAAVVSAHLELHVVADMVEPIGTFGALLVDAVPGHFGSTADLESADYAEEADDTGVVPSVATLTGAPGGVYSGELDSGGVAAVEAGAGDRMQLRLRFEVYTDNDLEEDQLRLHGGGAPEALRPRLVIVYAGPSGGA